MVIHVPDDDYISPEEFKETLMRFEETWGDDTEEIHMRMDDLMMHVLKNLGYSEGVEIINNTPVWYA